MSSRSLLRAIQRDCRESVSGVSLLKGKKAGGLPTNTCLSLAGDCSQSGNVLVHLVYPIPWLSKQVVMGA